MKSLARGILRRRWLVLTAFVLALVASLWASNLVDVNFTLTDYLPDNAPSTMGLRIMEAEFDSEPSNLRILIEDATIPEVLNYKAQIAAIPGMRDVTWLDDSINVKQPIQSMDQKAVDAWYRDGNAMITAYVDDGQSEAAIGALGEILGRRGRVSGDSVQSLETRLSVERDIKLIMMLAVPIILVILILSTNSYFEPILFLATIGFAIMIGKGTDLFLGQVSFITNSCAAILQLAISMDYAIMLLEAFGHNKDAGLQTFEAMTNAMVTSASAILSSSITTIAGFAVMMLMEFKVGYDMGIVLAKDIAISLISVLVLLPALALIFDKAIDKTRHRPFIPSLERLGKWGSRLCVPALVLIGAFVVVPSYLASDRVDFVYGTTKMITDPAATVVQDEAYIDALFDAANQMVMLVPTGDPAREQKLIDELNAMDEITSIASYASMAGTTIPVDYVGRDNVSVLIGEHYSRMILTTDVEIESDRAFELIKRIRETGERYFPGDHYLTGGTSNVYDMRDVVRRDDVVVNAMALLAIGAVLLINFRSVTLPLILLLTIKSSIWVNVSVPYFTGGDMYYMASLIIDAIQLGATVDYAILFTESYMAKRKAMRPKDAAAAAIASAASAIMTSSAILFTGGMTLGMLSSVAMVEQLGVLVGRGALISAIMVLTVLPALLMVFDPLIRITTIKPGFMTKRKSRELSASAAEEKGAMKSDAQQEDEEMDDYLAFLRRYGDDDADGIGVDQG